MSSTTAGANVTTIQTFDRAVRAQAPTPLALSWARVVDAAGDADRLSALGAFSELLVRFVNALVLPDYLRGVAVDDVEQRLLRLSRPSLGVLCGLYRTTCAALHARGDVFWDEPVAAGLTADAPAVRALDRLVELRNQSVHGHPSTTQRALLASDFMAAARDTLVAMPWLFRTRLVRVAARAVVGDSQQNGAAQFFVGDHPSPAPHDLTWSARLASHSVYLAHPDGQRLLDMEPFFAVADVDANRRDRLHLWKNIRDLTEMTLVADDVGHALRQRPLLLGEAVDFRTWAAARQHRPSPVVEETLAVHVLRAPAPDPALSSAPVDDGAASQPASTTTPARRRLAVLLPGRTAVVGAALFLAVGGIGALAALGGLGRVLPARCGDGVVADGEGCDDGNDVDGDACSAACVPTLSTLPSAPVWVGFRDAEVAAGMPLVAPSRRPPEYLLARAAYAQPATPVLLRTFRIMKTEASRGAFAAFLLDDSAGALERPPLRTPESQAWHRALIDAVRARHADDDAWRRPAQPLLPVEAPLDEAVAFCAWLGGTLPSEPQFEFAAKGPGEGRVFPWGSRPPRRSPDDCALVTAHFMTSLDPPAEVMCGDRQPTPVGSKPAGCTPEGVCDLSGNVDEWVVPGPVHWVLEPDPNEATTHKWIARLPGPRAADAGSFDVAMPCETAAWDDPLGLRTGVVRDCYHPGTRPEPLETHPAKDALGVVRGGNFDDSLPVFYQTRARYPYYPVNGSKGFRCTFLVDG